MNILVIGGGGREHALAWKIAQSPKTSKLFIAPGNGGTAALPNTENVAIAADDIEGLLAFAKNNKVDLTVVGPEVPLVMGLVDTFNQAGLRVFGPSGRAAQLEGSKDYAKQFMDKYKVPTAQFATFTSAEEAKKNVGIYGYPMVIKADGLAAGKGVVIAANKQEALDALDHMMVDRSFGQAGDKIVIEEFLEGIEASVLCFVDGKTIVPMESVQDYKKAFDDDEGPNTGGMGTYSPSLIYTKAIANKVQQTILDPIAKGFEAEGYAYKGILFIGLMIDGNDIRVLEFNCRFGDPETQALMPRLENDLVEVIESILDGNLEEVDLQWKDQTSICVVMASEGYPGSYEKGKEISGSKDAGLLFHAGTKLENDKLLTSGGRVLGVIGMGDTVIEARKNVYDRVPQVRFEGAQYRSDIGMLIR